MYTRDAPAYSKIRKRIFYKKEIMPSILAGSGISAFLKGGFRHAAMFVSHS
jgi:hypothetical protein